MQTRPLKHLTLEKIVDAAYFCGIDGTPVSVMIGAPPGSGKTWSTSALSEIELVIYQNTPLSPTQFRKRICKSARRMKCLIVDDLAFIERWDQDQYYNTFNMIHDGEIGHGQYNDEDHAFIKTSMILTCTWDYYHSHKKTMAGCGLMDRVIPCILQLSDETRLKYQELIINSITAGSYTGNPPFRKPTSEGENTGYKSDLLITKNVDPRLLTNLMRISQYLTIEETEELSDMAHAIDHSRYYLI